MAVNLQNLRWPVVLATMAVALGALFGGGYLMQAQTVDAPLQTFYGSHEAVVSHTVKKTNDRYEITIELTEEADLPSAYADLIKETERILGSQPFELRVKDRRSPELERALRRVNLYVQEGLATGRFATMADRIEAEAAEAGLEAAVAVDSARVYVVLRDGDHYLYSVVERPTVSGTPRGGERGYGL